jgi:hypothetical protein
MNVADIGHSGRSGYTRRAGDSVPKLEHDPMTRRPGDQSKPIVWRRACALVQRLKFVVSDRYRPERHYMRGPGPKSHARARSGTGPVAD